MTGRNRMIRMLVALTAPMAVYAGTLGVPCSSCGGHEPWIHHGLNWGLHGGNALLLFLVVEHLFGTRRALPAALIWGIHPLTAESVTSCAGTVNLLIGSLTLFVAFLLVRRVPGDTSRRWSFGVLAFGLMVFLGLSYVSGWGEVTGLGFIHDFDLYVPGLFLAAAATSWLPGREQMARRPGWTPWFVRLGAIGFFHLLGFLAIAQA